MQMPWLKAILGIMTGCLLSPFTALAGDVKSEVEEFRPAPTTRVETFSDLERYARSKAGEAYVPSPPLPAVLQNLDYDQFRLIHYRHERGVWLNKSPFWFEAFHRGFVHRDQVKINTLTADGEQEFLFDPRRFEYRGELSTIRVPRETGYAGVKLAGFFPGSKDPQEMVTFLGASYFRARAGNTVYGSSNRGLAINVGAEGPEEFPVFREFWIKQPDKADANVTVFALLDSESLTGAYQFTFQPGQKVSEMFVRSTLFFRKQPGKLAVAPITSMWMWGDGLVGPPLDKRPSVHDADGLLIKANDEWTWRALSRQSYPSISRIDVNDLQGFGLLQREQDYERYRDDQALYHKRPSIWIEPQTEFPAGYMELMELPGAHEGIDNIGAYWVVSDDVQLDQPLSFVYKIKYFSGDLPEAEGSAVAKASRTNVIRHNDEQSEIEFRVDFEGPLLADVKDLENVEVELTTIRARVTDQRLERKSDNKLMLVVTVEPESNDGPCEVRARLKQQGQPLTERWAYLCAVEPPRYKYPSVYTRIEE